MYGFWILLILLFLFVASMPAYPYSRGWGYWPGGIFLALLIFWLVLIYIGMIAFWWPWGVPVAAS